MTRILLFCLIWIAALDGHAATSNPPQPVQPFNAVLWTTTTLHSRAGKASVFMQRTVYTRDSAGNVRREIYQPTKGLQHDTTAPLEHVLNSSTSAWALPYAQSSKETVEKDVDLGVLQFSGLPAKGRRQTFQDRNGQRTHTLETWFCASLGLTVRMESSNSRGDTVFTDLSELQLGEPASLSAKTVSVASPAIPLLHLYRSLFTQISHIERDRQANDPSLHVNMNEIEDHLRKKIGLSTSEWQILIDRSLKVESYTREVSKQARSFADQDRAARKQNPLGGNTLAAGRATLHKMQLDLNTHVQGEIDQLKTAVGPNATTRIEAYLQGPLAASTSRITITAAQLQALRAQKGQAR